MPSSLQCPNCQARLKIPDGFTGKNAKCPGCAATVAVPQTASSSSNDAFSLDFSSTDFDSDPFKSNEPTSPNVSQDLSGLPSFEEAAFGQPQSSEYYVPIAPPQPTNNTEDKSLRIGKKHILIALGTCVASFLIVLVSGMMIMPSRSTQQAQSNGGIGGVSAKTTATEPEQLTNSSKATTPTAPPPTATTLTAPPPQATSPSSPPQLAQQSPPTQLNSDLAQQPESQPEQPTKTQPLRDSAVSQPKDGTRNIQSQIAQFEFESSIVGIALDPTSGNLCCIDPLGKKAILIDIEKNMASDPGTEIKDLEVQFNNPPQAIAFKKYQDAGFFLVTCIADKHLYVVDAKSFKLIEKIELAEYPFGALSVSANHDDPFVYYGSNQSLDSKIDTIAVVDLKKKMDRGAIKKHIDTFTILGDGNTLIHWSIGEGTSILKLSSQFNGDMPKFRAVYQTDARIGSHAITDQFGEYFSVGKSILTKEFREVAWSRNFFPKCFLRNKPLVLGIMDNELFAASYNTWKDYPKKMRLARSSAERMPDDLAAVVGIYIDGFDWNVVVDETNSRVMVAKDKVLIVAPLSALEIPDEPNLMVEVGRADLKVGSPSKVALTPVDSRVQLELSELPEGAKQTSEGLEWQPTNSHVGEHSILVKAVHGELSREFRTKLRVAQPFIKSPLKPTAMVVDITGNHLVCWRGSKLNANGSYSYSFLHNEGFEERVAVLPLKPGKEVETLSLEKPVLKAMVIGTHLAVAMVGQEMKVHIYKLGGLELVKSLVVKNPITNLSVEKDTILVHTPQETTVFQIGSFKQIRSLSANDPMMNSHRSSANSFQDTSKNNQFIDGNLENGVLVDRKSGNPMLMVSPSNIPVFGRSVDQSYQGSFLRQTGVRTTQANRGTLASPSEQTNTVVLIPPVPMKGSTVSVEVQPTGAKISRYDRLKVYRVNLVVEGQINERVPIVEEIFNSENEGELSACLQVVGDAVFLAIQDRIYRWKYAPSSKKEEQEIESFHIVPRQDHFVLKGNKTALKHQIRGAKGDVEYSLLSFAEGVSINSQTGVVHIDQSEFIESISPELSRSASGTVPQALERMQTVAARNAASEAKRTKAKISGFPVAIPICVQATDSEEQVAMLQYYVIADIQLRKIRDILQKQN